MNLSYLALNLMVATAITFSGSAQAQQNALISHLEFEASGRTAISLLAMTCSAESWSKFAQSSLAHNLKSDSVSQKFEFNSQRERLSMKKGAVVVEKNLSNGSLVATVSGVSVQGTDPCDILLALAAKRKISYLHLFLQSAQAISESVEAKSEIKGQAGVNYFLTGVSLMAAVGAVMWVTSPATAAAGVVIGSLIGIGAFSSAVDFTLKGRIAGAKLGSWERTEAIINSPGVRVKSCTEQNSVFEAKHAGDVYELVIQKSPNKSEELFVNGVQSERLFLGTAVRSMDRLRMIAESCISETDRNALNAKIKELIAAKSLREEELAPIVDPKPAEKKTPPNVS